MTDGFIPAHGGYRNLLSYQKAEIVYDATVRFCKRFLHKHDRTVGQMVEAARSGKQNIIEGSMASGTSKETEIKLTNVARASLEELYADYGDFLRLELTRFDGHYATMVAKGVRDAEVAWVTFSGTGCESSGIQGSGSHPASEIVMIMATSTPAASAKMLYFLFSCSTAGNRWVAPT